MFSVNLSGETPHAAASAGWHHAVSFYDNSSQLRALVSETTRARCATATVDATAAGASATPSVPRPRSCATPARTASATTTTATITTEKSAAVCATSYYTTARRLGG